jgi:hypothetical protein
MDIGPGRGFALGGYPHGHRAITFPAFEGSPYMYE